MGEQSTLSRSELPPHLKILSMRQRHRQRILPSNLYLICLQSFEKAAQGSETLSGAHLGQPESPFAQRGFYTRNPGF